MRITETKQIKNRSAYLVHNFGRGESTGILYIPVRIIDTRRNYGRLDVLITPAHGSGQAWVSETKLLEKDGRQTTVDGQNRVAILPNGGNEATKNSGKGDL